MIQQSKVDTQCIVKEYWIKMKIFSDKDKGINYDVCCYHDTLIPRKILYDVNAQLQPGLGQFKGLPSYIF